MKFSTIYMLENDDKIDIEQFYDNYKTEKRRIIEVH